MKPATNLLIVLQVQLEGAQRIYFSQLFRTFESIRFHSRT